MQEWLGTNVQPEEFGWNCVEGPFEPNQGYSKVCPVDISKNISCGCKTGCKTACTCVKNGMKCTAVCKCYHADEECRNKSEEDSTESDGHDSEMFDE